MALIDRLTADHRDKLEIHSSAAGTRLDLAALLATPAEGTQIYSCGPERLLTALDQATAHWPEDSLHVEHFTSNLAKLDPANEHAFEVELRDSGLTLQVAADQTVLDALRGANIDIQSDCEEGLCGSCEAPVLDGDIDHRDMVLTKTERTQNKSMMTCCSRACGTKISLAL
jgi:ferredoxin